MKKSTKETLHYILLVILITATVFLAHALSGFLEQMLMSTLSPLRILGWILLSIWYAIFIAIVFVPSDLILHKLLKI